MNEVLLLTLIVLVPALGYLGFEWWHRVHKRGYNYFISFHFVHDDDAKSGKKGDQGYGTATIEVASKIDCHEKIVALEQRVLEEEDFDKVKIMFWRRYD